MFGSLKRFINTINRFLAEICGWLLCIMVLFLCFDIVSRSLKEPVQGVTQMAVFVMIIVVYLGLGQCEKFERHIKVTAVYDRLPPTARKSIGVINYIIQIVVIGVITVAVGENVIYSIKKHEAVPGYFHLPIWPTKFVLFIGLVFYWLQVAVNLAEKIKKLSLFQKQ
jgi:TRAP-type C4-dicarboxylate transport system permease small subunit